MVTAQSGVDVGVGHTINSTKSKAKLPVIKRPTKKKPKDKPKRPLSAYNYFFKEEREKIVKIVLAEDPSAVKQNLDDDGYLDKESIGRLRKEGGKVSFEEMGKIIGQRWKNIDPDRLAKYSELASEDTERYKTEMQEYNCRQEAKMRNEALKPSISYATTPLGPVIPVDRGASYPDVRAVYGDGTVPYTGMPSSVMSSNGMPLGNIGPTSLGTPVVGNSTYGYGYGDFPGYSNMGMNAYGNGMPMMGYGGYSQTMETPNTYGGGSYGSMGMMNANNFSGAGGMTSYPPDQSYNSQPIDQQGAQGPHVGQGSHGGGGYNPNNAYGGNMQGGWGQG